MFLLCRCGGLLFLESGFSGLRGIYRIGTMLCIVFTLTLALSLDGRGDSVGCVVLLFPRTPCPSGLWDMSVMTGQGMVLLFTVGLIVLFPSRGHA